MRSMCDREDVARCWGSVVDVKRKMMVKDVVRPEFGLSAVVWAHEEARKDGRRSQRGAQRLESG